MNQPVMDQPATRTFTYEREFPHPPEKVWRALTEGPLLAQWLMRNDFAPVVGRKFNFRAEPSPHWNGVVDCEVKVVEPLKTLSYSWAGSGAEAATGPRTVVTWTLTPTAAGCVLRLDQSGFQMPKDEGFLKGASYGWTKMVGALDGVLAAL